MAKIKKALSLKNVNINPEDLESMSLQIEEIGKDETLVYDLFDLLREFAGASMDISITQSDDIPSAE